MGTDTSDEELMAGYRDGDAAAFERLYARHKGPLYRYLLRHCREPGAAEEMFQDVWLKLVGARRRYRPTARFTTYLYHLAHNRLIDHYRRQGRSVQEDEPPPLDGLPAAAEGQPERLAEQGERHQRLLAALAGLPAAQRDAFLLHQEAGLSVEQVARVAGVSREAAKSRLRYAVTRLKTAMTDPDDG